MGAIDPLTRKEQYFAYAGGENVSKPETPLTREEEYLNDICERLDDIGTPSAEDIQAAVTDYLDENGVEIGIRIATNEEFEEAFGFECE